MMVLAHHYLLWGKLLWLLYVSILKDLDYKGHRKHNSKKKYGKVASCKIVFKRYKIDKCKAKHCFS